jgi:hypothetical protein
VSEAQRRKGEVPQRASPYRMLTVREDIKSLEINLSTFFDLWGAG